MYKKAIEILKQNKDKLQDAQYLENEVLPKMGLNNRHLEQYPAFLYKYCGKGVQSWQYPNQFSKYLAYLSNLDIKSYVEIGCHKGGTLIVTVEYLSMFNFIQNVLCIDNWGRHRVRNYCKEKDFQYIVGDSQGTKFKKCLSERKWDLVFVDGNHSYEAVKKDYELVKNHAKYIVFHDICNEFCPGVKQIWQEVKSKHKNFQEWTAQYDEVGKSIMGIGLIEV